MTVQPAAQVVAALRIETKRLRPAKRKKAYWATLIASGGTAPYRWKKLRKSPPKGLKMSKKGRIHGKPRARGTRKFRVRVIDASGARSSRWVRIRVR